MNNQDFDRVFQRQGFDLYGEALGISKIISIEKNKYEEEVLFDVEANFFKGIKGMHTYNFSDGLFVFDYVQIRRNQTGVTSLKSQWMA